VGGTGSISTGAASQDELYRDAADKYGSSLERLASAYEADPEKRRDLSQDIHFQLWRSFQGYDARCSLRTWVYRVAHHVAASHVLRERRSFSNLVSLEELELLPNKDHGQSHVDQQINLERLSMLI
jgi:RNA polymerase sigma-70 factor (ECF subfamily)